MKSGRNLMIAGVASALAVFLIPMMPFAATAAETSDDTAGLSLSDSISIDNAVKTTTSNLNAVYNAVYTQTPNPKSRSAQNRVDRSVDALHASDAESNALKKQGAEQLETVRSMSKGDTPLTVDKVTIVQEGNVSVQSNSGDSMVVATADLRITRHIFEDDVDWEEIVPHRFTIDMENNTVVNILAEDQNWQDAQSTNEAVSSENRSSDEDESVSIDDEYAASNDSDTQFDAMKTSRAGVNRGAVAAYALKYALSPNRAYRYMGNAKDCTNFVSQAMYAGGWRKINGYYRNNNVWWYNSLNQSWTWGGAENFYRMTRTFHRSSIAKYVQNLRVGDILQYKNKGEANMRHSMVVTAKKGNFIYLSGHSNPIRNKPFTAITDRGKKQWFGHLV